MKFRFRRILLILALLVAAFIAVQVLSPTRGVQRRWDALIAACETHDREQLTVLFADNYSDRWGLKKPDAIQLAYEIFRQFLVVSIARETPVLAVAPDGATATTSAVIRVIGTGGPVAQLVVSGTAQLGTPTIFHWQRSSWKPWDWQLTRIENPNLKQDLRSLQKTLSNPGTGISLPL